MRQPHHGCMGSIERFLPRAPYAERHEILIEAPADVVFEAACNLDLQSLPLVRWIFRMRSWFMGGAEPPRDAFRRGLRAETAALGWETLALEPGRELVCGAVAQPWLGNVVFRGVPAERFAAFAEPDLVKIVWTLEAEPLGPSLTRFRTETRAAPTDAGAARKFQRYWRWAGFGIVLIRWLLLPALRRECQRGTRPASPGSTAAPHPASTAHSP